jgi:hypothetical protein
MRALGVIVLLTAALALTGAPAASAKARQPVLGSHAFAGKYGTGWGKYRPSTIFNGGDPSGLITKIHWKHWGRKKASGFGLNAIFRPEGGYYRKLARIQLSASNLGHCAAGRPLAYRHLSFRVPAKPGGKLGRWHSWSGAHTLCESAFG